MSEIEKFPVIHARGFRRQQEFLAMSWFRTLTCVGFLRKLTMKCVIIEIWCIMRNLSASNNTNVLNWKILDMRFRLFCLECHQKYLRNIKTYIHLFKAFQMLNVHLSFNPLHCLSYSDNSEIQVKIWLPIWYLFWLMRPIPTKCFI